VDITVFQCNGPDANAISRAAAELVSKVIITYVKFGELLLCLNACIGKGMLYSLLFPQTTLLFSERMRGLHGIYLTVPIVQVHEARQFTDTANFTLRCKDCQIGVKGEKEAIAHAKACQLWRILR